MDDTKGLKRRLDITIRNFKREDTDENRTDGQVGSGDWYRDIPKEEGRSLEEVVPVFSGLACDTNTAVSEELYSTHFSWVQSSRQLWGNLSDSSGLSSNFFRKMKHHTLVEAHFCKTESRCKMFNNTILTIVLKKRQVSFFVFKANGRAPSGECNAHQTFHAKNILP